jgi:RNA polymerase sigma-70 factor (ECF subfamily)
MLRSRKSRHEEPMGPEVPEPAVSAEQGMDPEQEMLMADSVGLALLVVLERLAPPERLAFVLHDMFAVPFEEIAPIVGRSADATRQLASRARRRVQGAEVDSAADLSRRRYIVDAFLAASKGGDFEGLLAVLDPDVVLRADAVAVRMGGHAEVRGATTVAQHFKGRAQSAQVGLIDGTVGIIVAPQGRLLLVLRPTISDGRIVAIDVVADPEHLGRLDIAALTADGQVQQRF